MMVDVGEYGAGFRDNVQLLKNMSFKVKNFNRPEEMDDMEDMEDFMIRSATRKGKDGLTKISYYTGEDQNVIIEFANKSELDAFVESMKASHLGKSGHIWAHPKNVQGMGQIYAKIEGLTVTMCLPSEMLSADL